MGLGLYISTGKLNGLGSDEQNLTQTRNNTVQTRHNTLPSLEFTVKTILIGNYSLSFICVLFKVQTRITDDTTPWINSLSNQSHPRVITKNQKGSPHVQREITAVRSRRLRCQMNVVQSLSFGKLI